MNVDALGVWFLKNELHQRLIRRFGAPEIRHRYLESEQPVRPDVDVLATTPTLQHEFASTRSAASPHKPSESKTVYRLRNARLNSASGYVFDTTGAMVADYASWPLSSLRTDRLATPGRARRRFTGADHLFLGTQGYYHWLIEDLPAYLQARAVSRDALTLIRPRSPRYVTDLLDLLGARFTEAPVSARIENLVFASKSTALVGHPIDVLSLREFQHSLRQTPLAASREDATQAPRLSSGTPVRKIYVSRRDSTRFPENESAVEECVLGYGFEIVSLASMSFSEQISLFASAHIVVGPHGAGLANIVWCAPGTTAVVEILQDKNPRCFEELAFAADLPYTAIVAANDGPWHVDIAALAKAIESAAIESAA